MTRQRKKFIAREPLRAPTHPGDVLKHDVLPALGLSVSVAAKQLRVTRQTLHKIMRGTMAITPEMAIKLGKFCGNGPDVWLGLQNAFDLWHAKKRLRGELGKIPSHEAANQYS